MLERLPRVLGLAFFALVLVASAAAFANEPIFVRPEQLDVRQILPTAPADASLQTKADLAELHHIEGMRTAEDIARAKADDGEEDIFVFKSVLGDGFTAKKLPLTATLSAHLRDDEPIFVSMGKDYWNRPRPLFIDPTLHPVCKLSHSGAYPSGHAVNGYLEALVLVAMVPERRDAIFARADEYARNRLVCGVHYPSDLEAGKRLAYALIGLIMNNPRFQVEFAQAKAELRQALALP